MSGMLQMVFLKSATISFGNPLSCDSRCVATERIHVICVYFENIHVDFVNRIIKRNISEYTTGLNYKYFDFNEKTNS